MNFQKISICFLQKKPHSTIHIQFMFFAFFKALMVILSLTERQEFENGAEEA